MALKATIFRATLQVADIGRHYYHDHALTIARHPSETDERMMVRLLVFGLHADASLTFGRGLSDDDEPDLWNKDLTGEIKIWIDVGQPDEKRIRKACGRAEQVFVYSFGVRNASGWWANVGAALERNRNLSVIQLPSAPTRALARLAQRNMRLNCTIQDGQIWMSDSNDTVEIQPLTLQAPVALR